MTTSENEPRPVPLLPSRRALIAGAAAVGASLVLPPLDLAAAAPVTGTRSRTITGHLGPGAADLEANPSVNGVLTKRCWAQAGAADTP